jgi:uncharacterized membrane protein (Fun14 family)
MQKAQGGFADWFGNGPWRSKSVLAAILLVVVGLGFWSTDHKSGPPQDQSERANTNAPGTSHLDPKSTGPVGSGLDWSKPLPGYVRISASYVVAYCIGWLFRRVMRLILVAGAVGLLLLGYGKLAGWDMTPAQEKMKRGGEWAQREATTAKDYLRGLLPSATAAGIGMFLGFRRRNNVGTSEPGA